MKYTWRLLLLNTVILLLISCGGSSSEEPTSPEPTTPSPALTPSPTPNPVPSPPPGEVTYKVTFNAIWSASSHPVNFPSNAHFSGLIGASHNVNVVYWDEGGLATPGIEAMAEVGSKFNLTQEVDANIAIGDTDKVISGGGIGLSPGKVEIVLPVNINFSFVTIVSMIAPSPDWFVGVSGLNLLQNGVWIEDLTVDLFVYDAGTDDGASYNSPDADTNPKELISKITAVPFFVTGEIKSVGQLIFKKM